MNKIILMSCLTSFLFTGTLQAQIFGGWFRGNNNGYYSNNGYYYNNGYQRQQPQQQQTSQKQTTQTQYKENTWYRWTDGSYRYYQNGQWHTEGPNKPGTTNNTQVATEKKSGDYSNVYNPSGYALTEAEKYIINSVNNLRAQYRLPPLVVSPGLMNSARSQTNMMRSYGMQHGLVSRPYGSSENIAPTSSPSYAMSMWIKSSPHFGNMTSGSHRFIGVGCSGGYATQQFSSYSDVKYSLTNPTPKDESDTESVDKKEDAATEQDQKDETTAAEELKVTETNLVRSDEFSSITEEVKEEVNGSDADTSSKDEKIDETNKEDKKDKTDSTDQIKSKIGFFDVKPLADDEYIEKVPVKGGVPGEYIPVVRKKNSY